MDAIPNFFVSVSVYLSDCFMSVCVFVQLSICFSFCVFFFTCLFILFAWLVISLCVYLFACMVCFWVFTMNILTVSLIGCLSVCLSVCLSFCLFVFLFLCLSVSFVFPNVYLLTSGLTKYLSGACAQCLILLFWTVVTVRVTYLKFYLTYCWQPHWPLID